MKRDMFTFKVRINGSEPLYKTIVVYAESDKLAEGLATAKITREWSSVYSPGKDVLQLELVNKI